MLVLILTVVIASYEDIKNREVSRKTIFAGLVAGLIDVSFSKELMYALAGAIIMAAPLYIMAHLFFLLTGEQGVGGGDIKIAFIYGLFLIHANLIYAAYFIAFSSAGIFLLIKKIRGNGKIENLGIPLIPFMSLGTVTAFIIHC